MPINADIPEDFIRNMSPDLLDTLLKDHTMSTEDTQRNIFWATQDYEPLGEGYEYRSPILPHLITGRNGRVIMPRVLKTRDTQSARSREMAEVFTPSWICNAQNNLIDDAWFGRTEVFNIEHTDNEGRHFWTATQEKITFPEDKTWKDYVRDNRLEITCGEAPYLVSRYDSTTGETIPIEERIGMLDRKLRVVSENTENTGEWLEWAQVAYKSVYGYEWQGDSLLIARENMLISFIEYFEAKFGKRPMLKSIRYIAYIISWNVWQMDGLKGVVPDTCTDKVLVEHDFFGGCTESIIPCEGCTKDDIRRHNGTYCLIRDWGSKEHKKIRFIDLKNSAT